MILVVDDDDSLREIVQSLLRAAGRRVLTAAGIAEAEAVLAAEKIDVMLLDVVVGDGNGWDALRRFAGRCRVVMMTGAQVDDEVRRDAKILGAAAVLQKPFTNEELLAALG